MTKKELERLIIRAGGPRVVAIRLGVSTQAVHQWRKGHRRVPPARAETLRNLTPA